MNSLTSSYQLPTFTGVLSHSRLMPAFLRDVSEEMTERTKLALDAKIRSGDYFVTLATALDSLARDMTSWQTRTTLEDMVSDLTYLQDHYMITKSESTE